MKISKKILAAMMASMITLGTASSAVVLTNSAVVNAATVPDFYFKPSENTYVLSDKKPSYEEFTFNVCYDIDETGSSSSPYYSEGLRVFVLGKTKEESEELYPETEITKENATTIIGDETNGIKAQLVSQSSNAGSYIKVNFTKVGSYDSLKGQSITLALVKAPKGSEAIKVGEKDVPNTVSTNDTPNASDILATARIQVDKVTITKENFSDFFMFPKAINLPDDKHLTLNKNNSYLFESEYYDTFFPSEVIDITMPTIGSNDTVKLIYKDASGNEVNLSKTPKIGEFTVYVEVKNNKIAEDTTTPTEIGKIKINPIKLTTIDTIMDMDPIEKGTLLTEQMVRSWITNVHTYNENFEVEIIDASAGTFSVKAKSTNTMYENISAGKTNGQAKYYEKTDKEIKTTVTSKTRALTDDEKDWLVYGNYLVAYEFTASSEKDGASNPAKYKWQITDKTNSGKGWSYNYTFGDFETKDHRSPYADSNPYYSIETPVESEDNYTNKITVYVIAGYEDKIDVKVRVADESLGTNEFASYETFNANLNTPKNESPSLPDYKTDLTTENSNLVITTTINKEQKDDLKVAIVNSTKALILYDGQMQAVSGSSNKVYHEIPLKNFADGTYKIYAYKGNYLNLGKLTNISKYPSEYYAMIASSDEEKTKFAIFNNQGEFVEFVSDNTIKDTNHKAFEIFKASKQGSGYVLSDNKCDDIKFEANKYLDKELNVVTVSNLIVGAKTQAQENAGPSSLPVHDGDIDAILEANKIKNNTKDKTKTAVKQIVNKQTDIVLHEIAKNTGRSYEDVKSSVVNYFGDQFLTDTFNFMKSVILHLYASILQSN